MQNNGQYYGVGIRFGKKKPRRGWGSGGSKVLRNLEKGGSRETGI